MTYYVMFVGHSCAPRLRLMDTSTDLKWIERIAQQAAENLAQNYHWFGIFNEHDTLVKEVCFGMELKFS